MARAIDAYASEPHLFDHIAPVWQALPEQARGRFLVHHSIAEHTAWLTTDVWMRHRIEVTTAPVLVASIRDLRAAGARPVVFLEHGAGQSYVNNPRHQSYAGGRGREKVVLFLAPNGRVSARNLMSYPNTPSVVVGCPKLDDVPTVHGDAVCISFHWPCVVAPEAGSAWNHYRQALPELARSFDTVIGHAHPRMFDDVAPIYEAAGIEPVRSFEEVLRRASVYAVDNSSTLFEFAATDRPVVVMNAPWYRRHIEHGLRFWEFADIGVQVDQPGELVAGIRWARADPPQQRARREEIVRQVYAFTDGHAAERAACAIGEEMQRVNPDPERIPQRSL